MMERGALTPCDGSGIINWLNGNIQSGDGRFMSVFLFEPTGVNPYYLALKKVSIPLGHPYLVSATPSTSAGTLPAGTYYYVITALDGVGGETIASNELSATLGATGEIALTWNVVPNTFAYNVYRGTSSGAEALLSGSSLPVIQPNPITGTISFTDNGSSSVAATSFAINQIEVAANSNFVTMYLNSVYGSAIQIGQVWTVSGCSTAYFNQNYTISGTYPSNALNATATNTNGATPLTAFFSGTLTRVNSAPPLTDTTQQTALFQMPTSGMVPIEYTTSNIVAFFPASLAALGQVPTGGTGGGGTTGPGISGQGDSTPSGGVAGLVGPLPLMKQFTNQVCICLGNGFNMQVFSDPTGTATNPAFSGTVTSVAANEDEVIITTSTTFTAANIPVGSNIVLATTNTFLNGAYPVISVNTGAGTITVKTRSSANPATGTFTISTVPINLATGTFVPAYPEWTATTVYAVGDIIVPVTQPTPNIYVTCVQAGTSSGTEPSWTSVIGSEYADGTVLWQTTALLNSAAPPPPGAGHIEVYAGSLWAFNTSPTNTANGLDGPCAIRQSLNNNIFAWNPVYQAFLDKDDGAQGMGMGKFTITAQGIPPEGSLIAFKYRVPYQIIGVFGANNFAIQPVSSDMGCLAPRSIDFVPGFGLMRYTHLGIATFNGYKDEVVSEQIRPYLFPVNDFDTQDIIVADANYIPLSWATQTANPPMYAFAMPVGNSGGQLTQIMLYDLVLKAWAAPVNLPFAIGCMEQVQPITSNPITLIGGFSDGCLQRWQAGDVDWYTGGGSPIAVSWSLRTVTVASQNASQRLWARKVIFRGTNSGSAGTVNVVTRVSAVPTLNMNFPIGAEGDFDVFADIGITGIRFDAIISGTPHVEIEGVDWAIEPRPFGVPVSAI